MTEKLDKNITYRSVFSMFLDEAPSLSMVDKYLEGEDGVTDMQDYVGLHNVSRIAWSTSIGILDAVEIIVSSAVENGNIKFE